MSVPAFPGQIVDTGDAFKDLVDKLDQGMRDMAKAYNTLAAKVAETLKSWRYRAMVASSLAGLAVTHWIVENLKKVRDAVETAMEKCAEVLKHATPVISLIYVSFQWVTEVMSPASNLVSKTRTPAEDALAAWTGGAATAYTLKATQQQSAVREASTKAKFASDWLFGIAQANVEFVTSLLSFIPEIVSKLTAAAVKAGTVINIPWAISDTADVVGIIVKKLLDELLAAPNRYLDALDKNRELLANRTNYENFPDGKWPDSVRV